MTAVEFYIHGNPVPQDRPRHATRKKKGGGTFIATFDTNRSKEWKKTIADHAKKIGVQPFPAGLPLALTVQFYLDRPKTVKRRHPTAKPDLDNLTKAVQDALNGIAYMDDSQICIVHAAKHYGAGQPGVWVGIREVKE